MKAYLDAGALGEDLVDKPGFQWDKESRESRISLSLSYAIVDPRRSYDILLGSFLKRGHFDGSFDKLAPKINVW